MYYGDFVSCTSEDQQNFLSDRRMNDNMQDDIEDDTE